MKTIFEKIIEREIPADIEYEDDHCIAFHDIDPQAPIHLLIIPKTVIPRVAEGDAFPPETLGHLLQVAARLSKEPALNLSEGFRLVINNGPDGGETVPHLHIHLLGGRKLNWPPGWEWFTVLSSICY